LELRPAESASSGADSKPVLFRPSLGDRFAQKVPIQVFTFRINTGKIFSSGGLVFFDQFVEELIRSMFQIN
jgi:hypothetical protein